MADLLVKRLSCNRVPGNGFSALFACITGTGLAADNDDEFATGLVCQEVGLHFGKGAANTFLMDFRNFTAYAARSVGSKHFSHFV